LQLSGVSAVVPSHHEYNIFIEKHFMLGLNSCLSRPRSRWPCVSVSSTPLQPSLSQPYLSPVPQRAGFAASGSSYVLMLPNAALADAALAPLPRLAGGGGGGSGALAPGALATLRAVTLDGNALRELTGLAAACPDLREVRAVANALTDLRGLEGCAGAARREGEDGRRGGGGQGGGRRDHCMGRPRRKLCAAFAPTSSELVKCMYRCMARSLGPAPPKWLSHRSWTSPFPCPPLTPFGGTSPPDLLLVDSCRHRHSPLPPARSAKHLEKLVLSRNPIATLLPRALAASRASGAPPLALGLAPALDLRFLRVLHLDGARLTSLEGLDRALSLVELDVSDNALRSLAPLGAGGAAPRLAALRAARNRLRAVPPELAALPLTELDLAGNPLSDVAWMSAPAAGSLSGLAVSAAAAGAARAGGAGAPSAAAPPPAAAPGAPPSP
jgi:hypothetical protein